MLVTKYQYLYLSQNISQNHLYQRVNLFTENGLLNNYVLIYIGLFATLFYCIFYFKKNLQSLMLIR